VGPTLKQGLCESGCCAGCVYFPTTAIVSLLGVTEDGGSTEIAVVGREGMVGVSLFMGGHSTPSRAVVQSAGQGYRLSADVLMAEFNRSAPVMHLLLRYTQALITQMAQVAVCNRHPRLDEPLCPWLRPNLDPLDGRERNRRLGSADTFQRVRGRAHGLAERGLGKLLLLAQSDEQHALRGEPVHGVKQQRGAAATGNVARLDDVDTGEVGRADDRRRG